jgi:hypothetical protein
MSHDPNYISIITAQAVLDMEDKIEMLREQLKAQTHIIHDLQTENMVLRKQLEERKNARSEKDYED